MKITNSEVIKNAEQELLDGIIADLDWSVVEKIIKEKHHLDLDEEVAFKKGDMVVFGNQVAYQLDFDVKLTLSILLDREGNHISTGTGGSAESPPSPSEEAPDVEGLEQEKIESEEAKGEGYEAALRAMDDEDPIETSDMETTETL